MTTRVRYLSNHAIVSPKLVTALFGEDGQISLLTDRKTMKFTPIYLDNGGPRIGIARHVKNGAKVAFGMREVRIKAEGGAAVLTDEVAETFSDIYLDNGAAQPAEPPSDEPASGGETVPPPTVPPVVAPPVVAPPVVAPGVFDIYVAPWGDDANPGTATAPRKTIPSVSGKSVGIAPGLYEQTATIMAGAGATYHGWGGRPEITGGRAVQGQPCDASDAPFLGAIWTECRKYTVPLSELPGGKASAAMPTENGKLLSMAMTRVANPKHPLSEVYVKDWPTVQHVLAGTAITGCVHPATAGLTQAQVMACTVEFIGSPNQNYQTTVAGYDGTTVTFANQGVVYENSDLRDRCALSNCLPLMERGGWGYRVNGASTVIYVRPYDPANPGAVRVARIGSLFRTAGAGVTIRDVRLTHTCDTGAKTNKVYPVMVEHDDFTFTDFEIENVARGTSKDYGAVYALNCDRPTIQRGMIRGARKMFGIFLHGTTPLGVDQPLVTDIYMTDVDNSPVRAFGVNRPVIAFIDYPACGLEAHSNQINFYEGCSEALLWDVHSGDTGGYITFQESLAPIIVLSKIHVSNKSGMAGGRAIVDQNRSPIPGTSSKGYVLSSTIVPNMPDVAKGNSLGLGKAGLPLTWEVWDSIYHGASPAVLSQISGGNNITTNKNPIVASDRQMTVNEVYVDPANGDFTLKPVGQGGDRRAIIAQLQQMFPRFTRWNESRGGTVDWANAPLGV